MKALALFALVPLVGLSVAPQKPTPKAAPPDEFARSVAPYLKTYCVPCHTGATASAGMMLDPFLDPATLSKDPDTWKQFVHKIRTGQMPPPGSPRPAPAVAKAITTWISGEVARREKTMMAEAGRVTARRLNRVEYNNTVRDLLGVDLRPADDFPQDDSGYGFDNIGDVLSLSPPLMEKYLAAAEKVARAALFGVEKEPPRLIELKPSRREPAQGIPPEYDRTGYSMPHSTHASYRFPISGKYQIRGVLTGLRPKNADPLTLGLWIDGKKVSQIEYSPQGIENFPGGPMELYGQRTIFPKVPISAGEHWIAVAIERVYEGFPPSMGGPNPSRLPEPPPRPRNLRFLDPPADATPEQIAEFAERRKRFEENLKRQQSQLVNNTRVGSMEIGGPYEQPAGPSPRSRALLLTCGHAPGKHLPGCGKAILTSFVTRAFRRPVAAAELAPYLSLLERARKESGSLEEGLAVAVEAVLVSPHFLFRIEHGLPGKDATRRLTDHELASRLSYFLWSTMPDTSLRRAADTGTLRQPAVLEAQVRRMLRDPRADALVENFGGQWLELRKLESIKPDREKFNEFDESLRLSMRQETERFFEEIVRADRPVTDFLDADYTFVNERLASFYGMKDVHGPEFRRVSLADSPRRGVMGQASILTITSMPNRTSPVTRGKWILDNLLGTPPAPPPPGIPTLEETKVDPGASLRQQLEEHRKKPICASCHNRLDPLGFGLENYNAIGAWRTADGKQTIDASGTLPTGKSFTGPRELIGLLDSDRDAFTRCLTSKLLTYALGRGVERFDQPTVQQIAARVARDDYRFSRLALEIVQSLPFQQRKETLPGESGPSKLSVAPNAPAGSGRRPRAADPGRDDAGVRGAVARR